MGRSRAHCRAIFHPYPPSSPLNRMSDTPPNPDLLRALGKLVRGLSALFWGLPAALIVCFGTAVLGWFRALSIVPVLVTTGMLLYGLWQFGAFQRQERPGGWRWTGRGWWRWSTSASARSSIGGTKFRRIRFHRRGRDAGRDGTLVPVQSQSGDQPARGNVAGRNLAAGDAAIHLAQPRALVALLILVSVYIFLLQMPSLPTPLLILLASFATLQPIHGHVARVVATVADHGTALENQGSHPGKRLQPSRLRWSELGASIVRRPAISASFPWGRHFTAFPSANSLATEFSLHRLSPVKTASLRSL